MHLKIRHGWADTYIADGTNKKDADASVGYREPRSSDREKYFRRGGKGGKGGKRLIIK